MTRRSRNPETDHNTSYLIDDFFGASYNQRIWLVRGGSGELRVDGIGGQIELFLWDFYDDYEMYLARPCLAAVDYRVTWRARLDALTTRRLEVGVNAEDPNNENDFSAWAFDADVGSNWLMVTSAGGTANSVDSGIAADTNWHEFAVLGGLQVTGQTSSRGAPRPRTGWTAEASHNTATAVRAVDANAGNSWSSGTNQIVGMYWQTNMGAAVTFDRLVMDSSAAQPNRYPRAFDVYVSNNGTDWTYVTSGTGSNRLVEVTFTSQTAQYVRVILTSAFAQQWQIYNFFVFAPSGNVDVVVPAVAFLLDGVLVGSSVTNTTKLNVSPYIKLFSKAASLMTGYTDWVEAYGVRV